MPRPTKPSVLLVNPWIHDFAAFDFWARPLGLLTVGGALREAGVAATLLDLTDAQSPHLPAGLRPRRRFGRGRFPSQQIPRPRELPFINRKFRRYGLPPEAAEAALAALPRPDAALVTSMMTYWHPGVRETIALLKRRWPKLPVLLGGVYATLCPEHARAHMGADLVAPGPLEEAAAALGEFLGVAMPAFDSADPPSPAYELHPHADSAALLTSRGCPRACPYCGVRRLQPTFVRYSPAAVKRDARRLVEELGVADIALVDDAFLHDAARALDILGRLATLAPQPRLHAASGLSCRGITPAVARAMKAAGFATLRLGLETADPARQRDLGGKATCDDFLEAIGNLAAAGFGREQVGAYVLIGLPDQAPAEVEETVDWVFGQGIQPHLTEYSPTPGSPLFARARHMSAFDLSEPLFHNPTLLPCADAVMTRAAVQRIREKISRRRRDA
jgi:radical SAM superfamily enzyme YgiQ (UPF0313 family)